MLEGREAHFVTIEKVNKMLIGIVFGLPLKERNCRIAFTGSELCLATKSYRKAVLNLTP